MTTPTPDRPELNEAPLPDELEQAYRAASRLADDGHGPAPRVRASVLAMAHEMAHRAAQQAAPGKEDRVSPAVADVGAWRPASANRSSWRLRAGAAACVAVLAGVTAWQLDAGRARDAERLTVASAAPAATAAPDIGDSARAPAPVVVAQAPPAAEAPMARAALATRAAPATRAAQATQTQAASEAREPAGRARQAAADTEVASADLPLGAALAKQSAPTAPTALTAPTAPTAPAPVARLSASHPASPPLQRAAESGDLDQLQALLARPGIDVDAPDGEGRTALLHAVLAGQVSTVRALLAAGADPDRADRSGTTPRRAAQAAGNGDVATLFSRERVDP